MKMQLTGLNRTIRMAILLPIVTLFVQTFCNGQEIRDFKVKNQSNQVERTRMLDLLRLELYGMVRQETVFVVDYFRVCGKFAWMEGSVQRKDGRKLEVSEDYDCCHVEALFRKEGGEWKLETHGAFATDVWYTCLVKSYPDLDLRVFSQKALQAQNPCE